MYSNATSCDTHFCLLFPSGIGTFMMKGDVLKQALDYALFVGYRHIDTAASYQNEAEVGEVLQDWLKAGKISRKDVFVTTKIPRTSLAKSDALQSAEESRSKLKVKKVDMLLIHHPWAQVTDKNGTSRNVHIDILETWKALETVVQNEHAANIGVSNFTVRQIQRLLNVAKIPPSNAQSECHVFYQQHQLKSFCDKNDIVMSAYSPMGALGRPEQQQTRPERLTDDPLIKDLAAQYNKTPHQILLNFLLMRGFSVLPKSCHPDRLKENFESFSFKLSDRDVQNIYSLDKGIKFFEFRYLQQHPEFFKNEHF